MKRSISLLRIIVLPAACAALLWSQVRQQESNPQPRLPGGQSQREEILKADHEKSLRDAAQMLKLVEELKVELEKNDRHILSVSSLKKADEIEKLVKRIRGRLRRF